MLVGPRPSRDPSENSPRPGASFQTTEDSPPSLGTSPRTTAHCAREETGPCGWGAGPPPRSEGSGRGDRRESSMQKITGRKRFFVPSRSGHSEARDWLLTRAWPGPVQGQSSEPTPGGPVASPELWTWAEPGGAHSTAGGGHLRSGPPFPHLSPLCDICDLRPIVALFPQGPGSDQGRSQRGKKQSPPDRADGQRSPVGRGGGDEHWGPWEYS